MVIPGCTDARGGVRRRSGSGSTDPPRRVTVFWRAPIRFRSVFFYETVRVSYGDLIPRRNDLVKSLVKAAMLLQSSDVILVAEVVTMFARIRARGALKIAENKQSHDISCQKIKPADPNRPGPSIPSIINKLPSNPPRFHPGSQRKISQMSLFSQAEIACKITATNTNRLNTNRAARVVSCEELSDGDPWVH
ncbi:hypothetical protein CEXT_314861 [Caerostris extrusa]|uniref:Uncharacterized protein n=1 Tax=Caerostris extrusa TaxID=172846 RepID=A0AAV4U3E5_CAEEX|nr:hypothetical protein CEXT_314861 [Caerostris extrusa]